MYRTKILNLSVLSLILAVGPAVGAGCESMGFRAADYHPNIDPANFQTTIDNPYYPLVPGSTWKYMENDKGEIGENVITVTHNTKMLMSVQCVVVHDTVTKNGRLAEDTYDWLAQDKQGTVWYFGEDTKEISPGGLVSTQGSWEAGVKGAQPGIIMPANPTPGEPYRQEYGRDVAEDMGQIVAINESVAVPAGNFTDCVKTKDWSLLEPGYENKWYCKGVGVVKEVALDGEVAMLVSVTRP